MKNKLVEDLVLTPIQKQLEKYKKVVDWLNDFPVKITQDYS